MAIELKPFADLDAEAVAQNRDETITRVQEDNPAIDLRRGVLQDLLANYHAILATQRQANVDDYLNARSLKALNADPLGADPDLVDDVLSNYLLTRKPGAVATGPVTIVVSDDVTVTIAQGAVFEANDRRYVTTRVYTARVEIDQVVDAGDRFLQQVSDAQWAFTIDVEAEEEGDGGALRKDTILTPLVTPANYVTSYAANDFTGGLSEETNAELLERLQEGIAAKAICNRTNMRAALRSVDEFARVVRSSIIGMGDAEMVRDRHWIMPISGGGRVDWYVRTQERLLRATLTKPAVLAAKDGAVGLWQVAINRNDAPGFYELRNVRLPTTGEAVGGFTVLEEVRSPDLTAIDGLQPDVDEESNEWAYTRFQTAVLRFYDSTTDATELAVGTQQDYEIEAVYQPLIADLQDYVASRDVAHCGADCLVKAPVPCFVQVRLTVHKRSGEPDPDVAGIKDAIAAAVNDVGFVGTLYASRLHDVTHAFLENAQALGAIDMAGRIRYVDGSSVYLRSDEVLEVPDDPSNFVSAKTVQFFADPDDVVVTVSTDVPSEV